MNKKDEIRQEKPFNFGIESSPVVKQTEHKLENGYQRIESEKPSVGEGYVPQKQQDEDTKGIQAYIPMSLYERLVMRKLKTKESLGSMFIQALRLWVDVQEGKKSINTNHQ